MCMNVPLYLRKQTRYRNRLPHSRCGSRLVSTHLSGRHSANAYAPSLYRCFIVGPIIAIRARTRHNHMACTIDTDQRCSFFHIAILHRHAIGSARERANRNLRSGTSNLCTATHMSSINRLICPYPVIAASSKSGRGENHGTDCSNGSNSYAHSLFQHRGSSPQSHSHIFIGSAYIKFRKTHLF